MAINSPLSSTNTYYTFNNPAANTQHLAPSASHLPYGSNAEEPVTHASNRQKRNARPNTGRPYTQAALLGGFRQKWDTMNCVTVAGIKAAMQRFGGPNEVYFSVQRTHYGFDVRMRDDPKKIYPMTNNELAYAATRSGFTGNNQQILNEANFMYAVSAKRAQLENNNGYAAESFGHALNSLDSWEHTEEGLYRLGLAHYVQHTTAQDLLNGAPGVIAKNNHVFTVLNGRADDYGTPGYIPHPRAPALKLR